MVFTELIRVPGRVPKDSIVRFFNLLPGHSVGLAKYPFWSFIRTKGKNHRASLFTGLSQIFRFCRIINHRKYQRTNIKSRKPLCPSDAEKKQPSGMINGNFSSRKYLSLVPKILGALSLYGPFSHGRLFFSPPLTPGYSKGKTTFAGSPPWLARIYPPRYRALTHFWAFYPFFQIFAPG